MEQVCKFQSIFSLTDFHYSRPSNKIYVAYFMYPAFLFRPIIVFLLFSSPEHEVFRVSYCDRSVRPFTITKKKKKNPSAPKLTIRFQSNFTEMKSLGYALSKYFKELNSVKNSGCHGNRVKKLQKIFLSQIVRARAFIFGM